MLRTAITVAFLVSLPHSPALAQRAELRPAESIMLPGVSDSNSPAHWWRGEFHVTQSDGVPVLSKGEGQQERLKTRAVMLDTYISVPLWIESTWVDGDGTVYAWYHSEEGVCDTLSAPKIGALVSVDGGRYYEDLGIVLQSGDYPDCNAQNGYFAGGHGDFTVLLDSSREYFYFYFSNYGGPAASQGIAVARMAFADRKRPGGRVNKFYNGSWDEPGLFGRVTPIMPVGASWNRPDTDAFWGPSVHWNTFLGQYVMLMSRTCCEPGWPAEGIFVSFNPALDNPHGWTQPQRLLGPGAAGWYPQVIGLQAGGTDKLAGEVARFYMGSDSDYEIVFGW